MAATDNRIVSVESGNITVKNMVAPMSKAELNAKSDMLKQQALTDAAKTKSDSASSIFIGKIILVVFEFIVVIILALLAFIH